MCVAGLHRINTALSRAAGAIRGEPGAWPLGGIGPRTGALLEAHIRESRPRRILECGPGTSTLVMSRAVLEHCPSSRIVCLENSRAWAALVERRLRSEGLDEFVSILTAPLTPCDAPGCAHAWYASADEARTRGPYDLVFIDGPHATDGLPRRAPALHALWGSIADGATILLDDGRRAGERACVRSWLDAHGEQLRAELLPIEKGVWRLVKRAPARTDVVMTPAALAVGAPV